MADASRTLAVDTDMIEGCRLLTLAGSLTSRTYLAVRDTVIAAALDGPRAVLVDVERLRVPAVSAWTAFSSARWQVRHWPGVPIIVVCAPPTVTEVLDRNGFTRHVPSLPTVDDALRILGDRREQRCHRTAVLAASPRASHRSRTLVAAWLTEWEREELVPAATVIVDALVENVLTHTDSAPTVTAEIDGTAVTIAVHDTARAPAMRREPAGAPHIRVSGLAVVAAVCRVWGTTPTATGKAVWAVLGPECDLG